MNNEQKADLLPSASLEQNGLLGDVSYREYLDFLESEICKANAFGKKCQRVDDDFNSAQTWYSIAEAFVVAKEQFIKTFKIK